ncbi:MAG: arylamine N-acetyltransferase [Undibacterium sp.]|nr:arylamine N-acetyltransferase [Undibacterium sp.]
MKATNFDLKQYFLRIGFVGPAQADLGTLTSLMRCQLRSVPFENLDVQAKQVVSLVPEEIVEKILTRGRGGYCYEVNGIFSMALEALGIGYRYVAARPMFYPMRRPRTHMALLACIDGEEYLCDLGFGSHGLRAPLALAQLNIAVTQDRETYQLSQPNEGEYLLQTLVDGAWLNQYGFDLSKQEWVDFVPANYFNSTHPDTIFVQKYLVIRQTEQGRKLLVGDVFQVVSETGVEKRVVTQEELPALLWQEFGLRR